MNFSCICSEDSVSYAISADSLEQFLHARIFRFEERYPVFDNPVGYLSDVFSEDRLLFEPFRTKAIAFRGLPFSLSDAPVPAAPGMIGVRHELPDGSTLHCNMAANFIHEISMYFSGAQVCHSMAGLLRHAILFSDTRQPSIWVNVDIRWMEVAVVSEKKLQFANHYRWYHKEDIIYYISAIIDMLSISGPVYQLIGAACTKELSSFIANTLSLNDDQILNPDPWGGQIVDLIALRECA